MMTTRTPSRRPALDTNATRPPATATRPKPRPRARTRTRSEPAGDQIRASVPSPAGTVAATSPDGEIASPETLNPSYGPNEIWRCSIPPWTEKTISAPSGHRRHTDAAGERDVARIGARAATATSTRRPPLRRKTPSSSSTTSPGVGGLDRRHDREQRRCTRVRQHSREPGTGTRSEEGDARAHAEESRYRHELRADRRDIAHARRRAAPEGRRHHPAGLAPEHLITHQRGPGGGASRDRAHTRGRGRRAGRQCKKNRRLEG